MDKRGIVWPDMLAVFDNPDLVRFSGLDRNGRPKWILAGMTSGGLAIGIVCVLDANEFGDLVVFITVYESKEL